VAFGSSVPITAASATWVQWGDGIKREARLRHYRLFFFSTCTEAIRTISLLQHDQDRPEDLDTEAEDHAADSVRYACIPAPGRLRHQPRKNL
jgi:hypothetical protein